MRSWLFVPGDSPRKLEKAWSSGADVLILDLEDSVAPQAKAEARRISADFLAAAPGAGSPRLFVRVNALDTGLTDADIEAVLPCRPAGLMLPKSQSGRDVALLDAKLSAREPVADVADGATRIVVVATETARALFGLGTYAGSSPRLEAMTWGGEDLSADLGAGANHLPDGRWADPYRLARTLCLVGAVAAEVQPLDTVFTNFRDMEGLRAEAEAALRDGFAGKLAIHPAQVGVINAVFTPSEAEVARARAIVDAFAAAGDPGVIGLDGEMLDRPHLRRAARLLARAGAAS